MQCGFAVGVVKLFFFFQECKAAAFYFSIFFLFVSLFIYYLFSTENIALGKPSNFSAASPDQTSDPGFLAVDGDRSNRGEAVVNTTCVFSPPGFNNVDWTVDLQLNYSISGLLLVFRDTGL